MLFVPDKVNALAPLANVMPLNAVPAVKLLVLVTLDPEKISSSPATGAVPPQLPARVQLPEPPAHVRLEAIAEGATQPAHMPAIASRTAVRARE